VSGRGQVLDHVTKKPKTSFDVYWGADMLEISTDLTLKIRAKPDLTGSA